MARGGAPYLPIRPAGHKPAPVPYFHELMKAQNMLPVGITALAASAGDDDKKTENGEEEKDEDWEVDLPDKYREQIDKVRKDYGDKEADVLEKKIRKELKNLGAWQKDKGFLEESLFDQLDDIILDHVYEAHKKRTLHAQGGLVGINHLTRRL